MPIPCTRFALGLLVSLAGVSRADVDPTGQFTQSVDIAVPAFHDITPRVSLRYSSATGNGFAGVGWSLNEGSRITRVSATRGIARGDATDVYLLDGLELVPCASGSASPSCTTAATAFASSAGFFSTQIESYERIRQDAAGWTVWSRDGTQRAYVTKDAGMTFDLSTVTDTHGNAVHYTTWCDGPNDCYPDSITYADKPRGPNTPGVAGAEIRFVRELRPDPRVRATAIGTGHVQYRLHAIVVTMDGQPLRAYQLTYGASQSTGASIVSSIQEFGRDAVVKANDLYTAGPTPAMPPTMMTTRSLQDAGYTDRTTTVTATGAATFNSSSVPYDARFTDSPPITYMVGNYTDGSSDWFERPHGQVTGDFDGDGRTDWLSWSIANNNCTQFQTKTVLMTKTGSKATITNTIVAGPGPQNTLPFPERCQPQITSMDLNGDRVDDLLMIAGGQLTQILSTGGGQFTKRSTQAWPSKALDCAVVDVDGDGRDDVACTGDETGAVELTIARSLPDGTWQQSTDALGGLGVVKDHHMLVGGDLDGDGLADLAIAAEVGSQWYLHAGISDGAGGFHWSSQVTAWTDVVDLTAVDVNGDGKADLVARGAALYVAMSAKGATARFRPITVSSAGWMHDFTYGDYDGDGRVDLLLKQTQTWAHGRGDGQFDAPPAGTAMTDCDPTYGLNAINLRVAASDLNGDGRSDILCTSDVDSAYTLRDLVTPAITNHRHWIQGDISGDGIPELIHITHTNPGYVISTVFTLTGAKSNFVVSSVPGLDEPDTSRFLVMDVGSSTGAPDGKADLVLVDSSLGSLRVYTFLSNGDGTFTTVVDNPWKNASGTVVPYGGIDLQNWRPAEIDRDGRADLIHPIAIGSGVRVESLRSLGNGTWQLAGPDYFPQSTPNVLLAGTDFMVMDITGDGLSDLVHVEATATGNTLRTLLGNGDGTFTPQTTVLATSIRDLHRVKIADIDGDGLADLVHVGHNGTSRIDLQMYLSDGTGHWRSDAHSVAWPSSQAEDANLLEDLNLVRLMDIDGDGRADVVHLSSYIDAAGLPATAIVSAHNAGADAPMAWTTQLSKGLHLDSYTANYDNDPWRWQAWIDPYDGDPGLLYIHPTQSQAFVFRPARDRVTTIDNGTGGTTTVNYMPLLARRTYLPEGSLPTVVSAVTIRDLVASPAISETLSYGYGEARYSIARNQMGFGWRSVADHSSIELTRSTVDDACGVRPTQVQSMGLTGKLYTYDNFAYVAAGAAPYTCNQYVHDAYECEGTGACQLARSELLAIDIYGNTVVKQEAADQATTKMTYRPSAPVNAKQYIVDKPAYEARFAMTSAGNTLLSLSTFGYDTNAVTTGAGPLGELRVLERYDDTAGVYRRTKYDYDPTGQLTGTVDPDNHTESVEYDTRYGLYPARTCAGKTCRDLVVDPVSGQTQWITDDNKAATHMTYDAYGRLVLTELPGGGRTETKFLDLGVIAGPTRQRVRTEIADASPGDGVLWSEAWFDGLGRTYRTSREGGATEDTRYTDASRRPSSTSTIYAAGASPSGWTTFDYDPTGRLIATTAPDTTVRRTSYLLGKTISTDELGHAKATFHDGHGRVVRVEEQLAALVVTTHYVYDALGRLVTVTDHQNHVTSIAYDTLGRQLRATDPDRGTTSFTYTASGLVDSAKNADNQTIRYSYDGSGRRVLREDLDANNASIRTVTWTWDRDANGVPSGASLGRVVTMTDEQATSTLSAAYRYDDSGRVVETTRCADRKECMSTRASYDVAGRVETVTYPDENGGFGDGAETVTYGYNDTGRLDSVGRYATAFGYELDGRLATMTYANGVTTTMTYDPLRRWTDSVTATSPGGPIYDASYVHDSAGRIHDLHETAPTTTHFTYTFDDLGRLRDVTSSDPTRNEQFAFDEIGRMKWSLTTGDISYTDPTHAHAPTRSDLKFWRRYDAVGNVSALSDPGGRALDLSWNVDGTLASATNAMTGEATSFLYDPDGARVKKSSAAGTTVQFGPLVELVNGRMVTYYLAGDRLIARRDGAQVGYYTQDLKHSTRVVTDAAGRVTNQYSYSAFGSVVDSREAVAQDQEHGGGRREDEIEMTYMNARYYDPALMHFISADTIVPNRYDPQSFHRYSYAQQDPVDFWDPSGHIRANIERLKELRAESSLQWMYNRAGNTNCAPGYDRCFDMSWQEEAENAGSKIDDPIQAARVQAAEVASQKATAISAITGAVQAAAPPSMPEVLGPAPEPFPEAPAVDGIDPTSLHQWGEPAAPVNEAGIEASLPPIVPTFEPNIGNDVKAFVTDVAAVGKKLFQDGYVFKVGDLEVNFTMSGCSYLEFPQFMYGPGTSGDPDRASELRGRGGMDMMYPLLHLEPGTNVGLVPLLKFKF